MSVPLPFYRGIDAIINKFDARSRWLLTESRYLFFYRFSFFILSGLQYTKSGFHEVGMERGLGHQTLPAQKCHQNISDMINVDILIYFFFSWSKTKLIITQSILRLKISCAQKVTSSKSLSRIISTSILKTYELIYKLTLTNRQTNRETHGQIYSFS